jgi:hypothetical protein
MPQHASRERAALTDAIAATYASPRNFVDLAFRWGEGDLAGHDGPDAWQAELLDHIGAQMLGAAPAIRVAVASGHGVGKSALVAWLILWAMSTRPHLHGVVTANTRHQLSTKTWREVSLWLSRAINRDWFALSATKLVQVDHPDTWFVAAIPWRKDRPEAFAGQHGEHVLVIYDEASAIDDSIWDVSEGALTTQGAMWFAFGNPTRNTGRFRECFGRFRHRWSTRQIDARSSRIANGEQVRQWLDDYGEDSDFVRVRVRGVFPRAGALQFIGQDIIEAARCNTSSGEGPRIVGVDIARFGDDQTVLLLRQGDRIATLRRWRGLDTMQTASRVAEFAEREEPDTIFVDGAGVGGGVVDRLRQLGHDVIDVNGGGRATDDTAYFNLRAEMWGKMRAWLATANLPDDSELSADLASPEYGFDARNRLQLERKEDMKKRGLASPDSADALALTFAAPVRAQAHGAALPARTQTEYDPFTWPDQPAER